MKIDYYAFVVDEMGQEDYSKTFAKHNSHIYENFDFDVSVAKGIGKVAFLCKETGKFYDANWEELDLSGKVVMPRCTIPELKYLYDHLESSNAILATDKKDYNIIMDWPKFVSPKHHEVVPTKYGEFLENFDVYKEKFGKVFFKTKYKYISTEVRDVLKLGAEKFTSIESEDDLGGKLDKDFLSFFMSKPIYIVFTSDSIDHNDHRFGSLPNNTEVFVEPCLEIMKDTKYKHVPVEYRSFVVDGKFTTSRSWVPDSNVPEEVVELTQEIIESMPADMNKTFVVDVLGFKDEFGNVKYDLCEINPLPCSGYEHGSSIFLLEDIEDRHYPKYDSIEENHTM